MPSLIVWWDQRQVGTLSKGPGGKVVFRYAQAWLEDPTTPAVCLDLGSGEQWNSKPG